ncbi:MAG: hypothetical protein EXQ59_02685 [Acidobacteria bacterium]|nr:hypothetical protein [Acidobacteriota bacterium]
MHVRPSGAASSHGGRGRAGYADPEGIQSLRLVGPPRASPRRVHVLPADSPPLTLIGSCHFCVSPFIILGVRLTKSRFSRRAIVTAVAALALTAVYEVTTLDLTGGTDSVSRPDPNAPPTAGDHFSLSATAYCKGSVTAAGVAVQSGSAAADRTLLPLGSIIQVRTGNTRYDGLYTVLDTGPEIRGYDLDIYMWSCHEALDFGRKEVEITLVRRGWDPHATVGRPPTLLDRVLLRRPKPAPAAAGKPDPPLPSRQLLLSPDLLEKGPPLDLEPLVPPGEAPAPQAPGQGATRRDGQPGAPPTATTRLDPEPP